MDFTCNQNWDAMADAPRGKHCHQCSKNIIDFTVLTDSQILDLLAQNHQQICGRIAVDQLHRPLIPVSRNKWTFWKKAMLSLSLLGSQMIQRTKANVQEIKTEIRGNAINPKATTLTLRGRVMGEDSISIRSGVLVRLQGDTLHTTTDDSGYFELTINVESAEDKLTLEFTKEQCEMVVYETQVKDWVQNQWITMKSSVIKLYGGDPAIVEQLLHQTGRFALNEMVMADFRVSAYSTDNKRLSGVFIEIYSKDSLIDHGTTDSNGQVIFYKNVGTKGIPIRVKAKKDGMDFEVNETNLYPGLHPEMRIMATEHKRKMTMTGICSQRAILNHKMELNSNEVVMKNPIKNPVVRD